MKNYAIVLGVDKYSNAVDLPCCANDAQVIEGLLQSTGKYEILRLSSDVSKEKALEEISTFLPNDGAEIGEVLFFFSGHGLQDTDMHYVLNATNPQMISSTALNNAEVDAVVRKASPKLFVKIIDACNSGLSYIKGAVGLVSEDVELSSKGFENCIFMCSSKQTQLSFAGEPYSKFTKVLIDAVRHVGGTTVKFSDLQNYLSDVFNREHPKQTPYFSTQCDGTEVFCIKTDEVTAFLKMFDGKVETEQPSEMDADAAKVTAYIEKCRSDQEVRMLMEEVQKIMGEQQLADALLDKFYSLTCDTTVPFIHHSYREEPSIVKMLYKRPYSENLFVEIECTSVKQESPFGNWYPSYKKEPTSFISKANQVPCVIAYHLKGENDNLPDYVVPFIFVYSPTFFYVFTCTKQFLRKGWNSYEEIQGTKYTYAKFEYAGFSKKSWQEYLQKRFLESLEYAKRTLLEHIS